MLQCRQQTTHEGCLNSLITLRGFTYLRGDLYSYGKSKALGPPISNPRGEIHTGCGAMAMTVTFNPYLNSLISPHSNGVFARQRGSPVLLDTDVFSC